MTTRPRRRRGSRPRAPRGGDARLGGSAAKWRAPPRRRRPPAERAARRIRCASSLDCARELPGTRARDLVHELDSQDASLAENATASRNEGVAELVPVDARERHDAPAELARRVLLDLRLDRPSELRPEQPLQRQRRQLAAVGQANDLRAAALEAREERQRAAARAGVRREGG